MPKLPSKEELLNQTQTVQQPVVKSDLPENDVDKVKQETAYIKAKIEHDEITGIRDKPAVLKEREQAVTEKEQVIAAQLQDLEQRKTALYSTACPAAR